MHQKTDKRKHFKLQSDYIAFKMTIYLIQTSNFIHEPSLQTNLNKIIDFDRLHIIMHAHNIYIYIK